MSQTDAVHAIQVRVSGRVQGVGFRAATAHRARQLALSGWVRNLPDGRVELQAWGTPAALAALRDWLRSGPALARVDELECQPCSAGAATGFDIRPTPAQMA